MGAGANYQLGDTGGEVSHTLTLDEMPSHTHALQGGVPPSSSHGAPAHGPADTLWSLDVPTQAAGGDQPHENRPPYYALAYIMKL